MTDSKDISHCAVNSYWALLEHLLLATTYLLGLKTAVKA